MDAAQANRLAAQEVSDHFPVELTLCIDAGADASTAAQEVEPETEPEPEPEPAAESESGNAPRDDAAASKSHTISPHALSMLVLLPLILCS